MSKSRRYFLAQKEKPTREDFIKLVEKDLKSFGITYEEVISTKMTKQKFKIIATNAAFSQLLEKQNSHKKLNAYHTLIWKSSNI